MMAASFSRSSIGSNSRCEVHRATRLECDEDAPVGPAVDAVLGERGAEEVAAELLKAGTIVGGDPDVGVEVEAVELGLARSARGGVSQVRLVAETATRPPARGPRATRPWTEAPTRPARMGEASASGSARGRVVGGLELAAGEQPPHACADGGEDLCHVLIAWRGVG